ncbi:MAG: glycoside hydrolase family 97 C-terminal domain-containing protein, partial [Flavobacterium sp.]
FFVFVLFSTITLSQSLQSPDGKLEMSFELSDLGEPLYQLKFKNEVVIDQSKLGLELKELSIARKDKHSEDWFLGAITHENTRKTSLKLDFLSPRVKYKATIYSDTPGAHWENNPKAYRIRTIRVNSKSILPIIIAPSGGNAIHFTPEK